VLVAGDRSVGYPNLEGKYAYEALVSPAQKIDYVRSIGLLDGMTVPGSVILCYQRVVLEHCLATEGLERPRPGKRFRGSSRCPARATAWVSLEVSATAHRRRRS
jgi:hypothetical protein